MDIPINKLIDIILSLMIFGFCFFCFLDFIKKCRLISDANEYPGYLIKVRMKNNQIRHEVGFFEIGFLSSFAIFNIFNILILIIVYFLPSFYLSFIKNFSNILSFDGTFVIAICGILLTLFITIYGILFNYFIKGIISVYKERHVMQAISSGIYDFLHRCTVLNSVIITFVLLFIFLFSITQIGRASCRERV